VEGVDSDSCRTADDWRWNGWKFEHVNQGTTVDGNEGVRRGQSVRSSEEASNDRGAKGRREVESGV
jgi:hypothetical protein